MVKSTDVVLYNVSGLFLHFSICILYFVTDEKREEYFFFLSFLILAKFLYSGHASKPFVSWKFSLRKRFCIKMLRKALKVENKKKRKMYIAQT